MERLPVLSRLAVGIGCATLLLAGLSNARPGAATLPAPARAVAPSASSRQLASVRQERGQQTPRYSVILV